MKILQLGNSDALNRLGAVVLFWVVSCPSSAEAELIATISLDKSGPVGGRFEYAYEIENAPSSSVSINAFVLDVGPGADLQALQGPTGWIGDYDPLADPFELAFVSTEPQFDIPVDGSGIFSFTSPLDARPLPYFIANLAPNGSDNGSIFGDIEAPAIPVPEPRAFSLVSLIATAGLLWNRQRAIRMFNR